MRARGFTLLEVLVAVAITAMIGVGATQLLANIIDSRRITDIRAEQLASLQRFNMVVSRDIEQIINRGIRDQYGDPQPALLLNNGDYPLEFTRTGWRNSPVAQDPRSELQRIAYRTEDIDSDECESARVRLQSWGVTEPEGECLVRYYWPMLDQAPDAEPYTQVVLELVDQLEIELLVEEQAASSGESSQAQSRDWYAAWPALNVSEAATLTPVAMRWRIRMAEIGEIERLWLLPWGEF